MFEGIVLNRRQLKAPTKDQVTEHNVNMDVNDVFGRIEVPNGGLSDDEVLQRILTTDGTAPEYSTSLRKNQGRRIVHTNDGFTLRMGDVHYKQVTGGE